MNQKNEKPNDKQKNENIRTEYNAICEKLKTLPNFRFTLISLYVAAVGVIAFAGIQTDINFYAMIALTLFLWIIDLRTRGLIENISERGMQIEKDYWGYKGEKADEAYISHLRKKRFSKGKLFHLIPVPASHSLGIDLLLLSVILYSIYKILAC